MTACVKIKTQITLPATHLVMEVEISFLLFNFIIIKAANWLNKSNATCSHVYVKMYIKYSVCFFSKSKAL